jgi:hypothetical protein
MVAPLLWWSIHTVAVIDGIYSCSCGGCLRHLVADDEFPM